MLKTSSRLPGERRMRRAAEWAARMGFWVGERAAGLSVERTTTTKLVGVQHGLFCESNKCVVDEQCPGDGTGKGSRKFLGSNAQTLDAKMSA